MIKGEIFLNKIFQRITIIFLVFSLCFSVVLENISYVYANELEGSTLEEEPAKTEVNQTEEINDDTLEEENSDVDQTANQDNSELDTEHGLEPINSEEQFEAEGNGDEDLDGVSDPDFSYSFLID